MGGDCFMLYYSSNDKKVYGVNGSGRAPMDLTIDKLRASGVLGDSIPFLNVNAVTVPGAPAAWCDINQKFGTLPLSELLAPAIKLAENGFPVAPITAYFWKISEKNLLLQANGKQMLVGEMRAPRTGEIWVNTNVAKSLKLLAEKGKSGFYEGEIAQAIVDVIKQSGGYMTLEDLKAHKTTFDEPISVNYRGYDVYEIPPNGQGITALIALNILENFDISVLKHNSTEYLHVLIESLRLAFADTRHYVADPAYTKQPIQELLSKDYAKTRSTLALVTSISLDVQKGSPVNSSDTVYFCVVDKFGNAASLIQSNYTGFGSSISPNKTGFTLQNRGSNFSLDPTHLNALAPNKRPYHTIIPGMMTKDGELVCPFGVMGGFMQPQGHVQVVLNLIDHKMDPQATLDASRFCIADGTSNGIIALEEGIHAPTITALQKMGHKIQAPIVSHDRAFFGRGQIIIRDPITKVLCGASDPRADGLAAGY